MGREGAWPDFVVFAAPKSATTTLFEYLKTHPKVCLPVEKEAPYYCDDDLYRQGIAYFTRQFKHAKPDQLLGTVSPLYGTGLGFVSVDDVARRMSDDIPHVKLIALLRNPIRRAFSHHQMLTVRGYESRAFGDAVSDIVNGKPYDSSYQNPEIDYLAGSCYGSLFTTYLQYFEREQLRVMFTEDLIDDPVGETNRLLGFLGLEPLDSLPQVLARPGGSRPRSKLLSPGFLYAIPGVRRAWKALPVRYTHPVQYRLNLWNTRPGTSSSDEVASVHEQLVSYFADDVALLQELMGVETPWSEWP